MPVQIHSLDKTNPPADTRTAVSRADDRAGVVAHGKKPTGVGMPAGRCKVGRIDGKESQYFLKKIYAFCQTKTDSDNVKMMANIQSWLEEIC